MAGSQVGWAETFNGITSKQKEIEIMIRVSENAFILYIIGSGPDIFVLFQSGLGHGCISLHIQCHRVPKTPS